MTLNTTAGPVATDRELCTSRKIGATRERVFQAFADPARLAQWWGPEGFTNTFHEFDLRPGGSWRFVMHGPDGKDYPNEITFLDVVPPERVKLRHLSAPHFDLGITFADEGGETVVGWQQVFETPDICRRVSVFAKDANEQNLDRLAALVEKAG